MSTEDGRTAYAKACAEVLKTVREPVELENYLKRLVLESGFSREVLLAQIGISAPAKHTIVEKREGFQQKAKLSAQVDWPARTLLAVVATGRLPKGSIAPEEFEDPMLRALCEALLEGESAAALMERQTDDQSRALVGDILGIDTNVDDEGLMHMAQECLAKMRVERFERELKQLEESLPGLAGEPLAYATKRIPELTSKLVELYKLTKR